MTCESLINRFLDAYLHRELSPARRAEFRLHLALCRDCRRYLASYRRTVALARASAIEPAPLDPPPDELVQAILKMTRDAPPELR
ncbi:MAG TPA: zf-HC2 domain-containing protein [Phycisphaerae bacterium]|nr:zf-HC2 domain-containing protein [Phycisphaerae bacterium]